MTLLLHDNRVVADAGHRPSALGYIVRRPSRVEASNGAETVHRAGFSPAVGAIGAFALTLTVGLGLTHGFKPTMHLFDGFAMISGFTGALFFIYRDIRNDQRVAYIFGSLGITVAIGYINATCALIVMTTPLPLQDDLLMRASTAIGLDYTALMASIARHPPLGRALCVAYNLGGLVYAAPLFIAWTGDFVRLRRFVILGPLLLTACVTIAIFVPTKGYAVVAPLPSDVAAALPAGAAVYYDHIAELYRSGALRTLDPSNFNGVIVFPSYHTIMALLTIYAFWPMPALRRIALAVNGPMLLAIVPIGGHYIWDMVAAVALFAAALPIVAHLEPAMIEQSSKTAKYNSPDSAMPQG